MLSTVSHSRAVREVLPQIAGPRMTPYLEYLPGPNSNVHRVTLDSLPFRLGRTQPADFILPSCQISRLHAEIYAASDGCRIRDLASTNGTFLNGQRVRDAKLNHGDIVHLAHQELRFLAEQDEDEDENVHDTIHSTGGEPLSVFCNRPLLKDLIAHRLVRTFFQPIVALEQQTIVGYEALGRGAHGKLSASPGPLFSLAESCQLAGALSGAFRTAALAEARNLPGLPTLFLNTHPTEMSDGTLAATLQQIRGALPQAQQVVLEIHEQTITDSASLRFLHSLLRDLDIRLAYDDFGAGQSRLKELVDCPPDFIKLDMTLIRGLDQSRPRQDLIRAITRVAHDLGVEVLAEGIETVEEADISQWLGCTLGQGYLLGHPQAAPQADVDTWQFPMR